MPTYILLKKWTDEGIRTIKDSVQRPERVREVVKSVGGELKGSYVTFGRYDVILIIEAPDDEAMAKVSLNLGREGASHGETLRAFTEAEAAEIIKGL